MRGSTFRQPPFMGRLAQSGRNLVEFPRGFWPYPSATMSQGFDQVFPHLVGLTQLAQTPINTSDLAMDPHTLLAMDLFSNHHRCNKTDGTIVDQMNLEKLLPFYNEQRIP